MTFSRRREIWLLLLAFAIIELGYAVVWQAYLPTWRIIYKNADWHIFFPPIFMFIAWLLTSFALKKRNCRETLLLPLIALLTGIGLLFILRLAGGAYPLLAANPHADLTRFADYQRQLISFAVGWLALLGIILFWKDFRTLARYKYIVAFIAIILLLFTTIFGDATHGQTLSIRIGNLFSFQPHDLVKLLVVVFMAAYLVEKQELLSFAAGKHGFLTRMDFRYMGPLVLLWLLVMAFIFKDGDLGAALLLFGAFLCVLYLGTERKIYIAIGLGLFIIGGLSLFLLSGAHSSHGHARNRIQTRIAMWLNPWNEANDKGYQITQALIAVGNGRVVGAGLAGGYPERIPAVHTDMIYTAIAEDLGLVGSVALLAVFLLLIGRMFSISLRSDDRFGKLLAAGLAASLSLQTWVILAGVLKLIPLTGITLPFVSYGGTSLVVNLALVGFVLKVAEKPMENL